MATDNMLCNGNDLHSLMGTTSTYKLILKKTLTLAGYAGDLWCYYHATSKNMSCIWATHILTYNNCKSQQWLQRFLNK